MAKKILIVEDDKDVAELIELHLKDIGVELDKATNCDKGLLMALAHSYALVILDVVVPGCGGLELCKRIRAKNPSVPIMMLTSKSTEVDSGSD